LEDIQVSQAYAAELEGRKDISFRGSAAAMKFGPDNNLTEEI
jgi:hypothetical protein